MDGLRDNASDSCVDSKWSSLALDMRSSGETVRQFLSIDASCGEYASRMMGSRGFGL